jgi:hypothetical protein
MLTNKNYKNKILTGLAVLITLAVVSCGKKNQTPVTPLPPTDPNALGGGYGGGIGGTCGFSGAANQYYAPMSAGYSSDNNLTLTVSAGYGQTPIDYGNYPIQLSGCMILNDLQTSSPIYLNTASGSATFNRQSGIISAILQGQAQMPYNSGVYGYPQTFVPAIVKVYLNSGYGCTAQVYQGHIYGCAQVSVNNGQAYPYQFQ